MLQEVLDVNYQEWGFNAHYRPSIGNGHGLTVIRSQPDELSSFGETSIQTESHYFNVRITELARPEKDATLTIGESVYTIKKFMAINKSERLEWQLICYVEK